MLQETAGRNRWRLEPLISRRGEEASGVPTALSAGDHHPWIALGDLEPVQNASVCNLCETSELARLVTIDPQNFSAKSLPEPDLLMPTVGDGVHNASVWNLYNTEQPERASGLSPSVSLLGRTREIENDRQDQTGMFFEPSVLAHPGLGEIINARLAELTGLPPIMRTNEASRLEQRRLVGIVKKLPGIDVVIVDAEDARALATVLGVASDDPAVAAYLADELAGLNRGPHRRRGRPEVCIADSDGATRAMQLADIASRKRAKTPTILLFTFGSRLGVTLQRLLVDVHDAWKTAGRDPVVKGLVLHAHPDDSRAWAAVRNAFWHDNQSTLVALWLTYMPHRSPLDDEVAVLESAAKRPKLPAAIRKILEPRLAELHRSGPAAATVRPFWSAGSPPELRRTSYYGDQLIDRVTLAAVGSAMQRARLVHRPDDSPFWYRFDMPKIFRSYFDGLIHVSALRWMQPREGWWGATEEEQKLLVVEAQRQAPSDWSLVLPELLLAAALGKVPEVMYETLMPAAEAGLKSGFGKATEDWIRLGIYLATQERPRSAS